MFENDLKLKNIAIVIFLGFLMVAIIYSIFFGPVKKYTDSFSRSISVSADGKVMAEPDILKFSFSVISEGSNVEKLVLENNKKINQAIDFVKLQNIDEKDIETAQYNLNPRYEYNEKSKKSFISGYELRQGVAVKIRDLKKNLNIGTKILAELPKLGINQIDSISFEINDSEKYLTEARNKAIEKVKIKAKEMSEKSGIKLGKIISFYDYSNPPTPYPYYGGMGGGMEKSNMMMASSISPSIQSGSQEIIVNATLVYEIN